MTDSGSLMTLPRHLLVCTLIVVFSAAARAAAPMPMPMVPAATDAAIVAKCKAASFRRRPAGQMATTMRDMQIKRCIKAGGVLLD